MSRAEQARAYFKQGYNCAQAVVLAYRDKMGLDEQTAARLSSSFGGGLGRLREVCGAVSGACMVLGAVSGYTEATDQEGKKAHYARIQEFARRFKEENGSIICRELLGEKKEDNTGVPEERTEAYYKKRPCDELVACAAQILEDMLQEI